MGVLSVADKLQFVEKNLFFYFNPTALKEIYRSKLNLPRKLKDCIAGHVMPSSAS
jgi:hypothetical protein